MNFPSLTDLRGYLLNSNRGVPGPNCVGRIVCSQTSCPHTESGFLEPGIHYSRKAEFYSRFGYSDWRKLQLEKLSTFLGKLAATGCRRVWIGGSFISTKEHPNDIDGYWDSTRVDRALVSQLLPHLLIEGRAYSRQYMQTVYGVQFIEEPFPEQGTPAALFQTTRDGRKVGVIELPLKDFRYEVR